MNERSIFAAALEIADEEDRVAYLDAACNNDAALRSHIEELLAAELKLGSFLGQPPPALDATVDPSPNVERPGVMIGPYKLLQQIGEGGMGAVWMAEQQKPICRLVAVKIIKAGLDNAHVIARFEAERQALALMDNTHIAKVFDGGTTASGRPYLVMELVKGMPINKFCDEQRLSTMQRLELFTDVCQALQHAHQKGIIHRDIKPSNVLVAPYDGKPVVKVIDFGVAKAAGQKLTDRTLFTEFGAVVGTLEYMSPEQAELNNQDIDTRSDIYSLGVVLYELLTGTTPLTRQRVKQGTLLEMLRMIREEEPPRPSTRLSESTESLPTISAQRQTEPAKLANQLRGELDWIVMKSLEKDRNRRYETANAFAQDVGRFLRDEPVLAHPPSITYRMRKFARRRRLAISSFAAGLVTLLVMACGIGWVLWDHATRLAGTEHAVTVALAHADQLVEQAKKMPDAKSEDAAAALTVWRQAHDAARQAAAALSTGTADDELRQRVAAVESKIETGQRETERRLAISQRKERLFRDLDQARMARLRIIDQQFDLPRPQPNSTSRLWRTD